MHRPELWGLLSLFSGFFIKLGFLKNKDVLIIINYNVTELAYVIVTLKIKNKTIEIGNRNENK